MPASPYTKWGRADRRRCPPGTVITLSTFDTTPVANVGTASAVTFAGSSNRGLSNGGDSIYAYLAASDATVDTPTTHLAFIADGTTDAAPAALAANDEVVLGSFGSAIYGGSHSSQGTLSGYLPLISNTANWTTSSGGTTVSSLNTAAFTTSAGVTLSVADVAMSEGNAGTKTFTFTVSLSSPAGVGGVTFDIATADSTATAGQRLYRALADQPDDP